MGVQVGQWGLKGLWSCILHCPFALLGHLSSAVGKKVWQ